MQTLQILENISLTNRCVLVSNARADRVIQTIQYHNLSDKFCSVITKDDCLVGYNKFETAIRELQLAPSNLWVIENEQKNIDIASNLNIKHLILKDNENFYYLSK